MIVVDLRGQDRASGAIPGTAHIPAMDLLKESGRTWRSFGTSRLWHFFANIRRIGLRQWLDAFFAFFCNTLFLFSMVDHPSKAFKSDIFRRGKPKQQGRQLLQKELPVQAARRGA